MRVGFIDFEATGVDPKTARIIEYAFMLYDTDLEQPLVIKTSLVQGQKIPQEVQELTGIEEGMFPFGEHVEVAIDTIVLWSMFVEYWVGHNALEYDKVLLDEESLGRQKKLYNRGGCWIDTMYDLPYPKHIKDRKLTHLAAAHGFLNPMPHRALADVITLQKIFCKYPLDEIIKSAETKLLILRADVSFSNKELAKKRGYHWDSEKKIWIKKMRELHLEREIKESEFKVIVLC